MDDANPERRASKEKAMRFPKEYLWIPRDARHLQAWKNARNKAVILTLVVVGGVWLGGSLVASTVWPALAGFPAIVISLPIFEGLFVAWSRKDMRAIREWMTDNQHQRVNRETASTS